MKKQWLSLAVAAVLTSNVYAADVQTVNTLPVPSTINAVQSLETLPALSAVDMQAAFQQDAKPMQMAALSGQEMKETEGAFGFGGAAVGLGIYAGTNFYNSFQGWSNPQTYTNFSNNWSWTNAGLSAASGFVSGGYSNLMLRGVGYSGFSSQIAAPIVYQAPIRINGAGLGFSTFGVYRR